MLGVTLDRIPGHQIHHEMGYEFTSSYLVSRCEANGVVAKLAPVESHQSIGKVEVSLTSEASIREAQHGTPGGGRPHQLVICCQGNK